MTVTRLYPWITLVLVLLLPLAAWVGGRRAADRASIAAAEELRQERILSGRAAGSLYRELERERIRSDSALQELDAERERLRGERAARERAAATRYASAQELGRSVADALHALSPSEPRDSALVRLDRHLQEDESVVQAYEDALAAADAQLRTEVLVGATWKERALVAEVALEASRVETRLCREEAEEWRALANPGLFTRIRRGLPLVVGGFVAGAGAVLVAVVVV